MLGALALGGCETTSTPASAPASASSLPTTAAETKIPEVPRRPLPSNVEVQDLAQLDQLPVPRLQSAPRFPKAQREAKAKGEVRVEFVIGPNGEIYDAHAVQATHPDFGAAAVAAVATWKFLPGKKDGHAVWTRMQVPVVFELEGAPPPRIAVPMESAKMPADADVYDISKLDQQPVPRFQSRPVYPAHLRRNGVRGQAVVDFIVGPDGNVYNAFSVRETDPAFGAAAVEAVSKWKFRPGKIADRVVWTHMQVPVVFSLNGN